MTADRFEKPESKLVELKEELPQKNQIIKTCVAFANGAGGDLIIGVEDQTLKIKGISNETQEKLLNEITHSIIDSTSPSILPEIFFQKKGNHTIGVIRIYSGMKPPYFLKKEGLPKGVYIRVGASNRRASEEHLEELSRQRQKISYDEEPSNYEINKLNKQLVLEAYEKKLNSTQMLNEKILVRNVRSPNSYWITRAGILFFCDQPDLEIPESIIIISQFKGNKGREIIRTQELSGPIPQILGDSLQLLTLWMENQFSITKTGQLKGDLPVPIEALREAIVNALVHRKYSIPGAIKIALYENRLEIFSPGSFPGMISIDHLGDGTSYLRNPLIAKFARRMRLVEKMGSGIKLIFDSCREAQIKKPLYQEDGDFVKIIFSFEKQKQIEQPIDDFIRNLANKNKVIRIREIVKLLEISRNTATRKMNKLVKQKEFIRIGKGAGTYYVPVKK
ncbi:MAG: hypothetical protein CL678_09865 [Bdellovibrionaceae bacterium]|nr:hypothetical protein [Pseudobdellovibrionaceae bacterium]